MSKRYFICMVFVLASLAYFTSQAEAVTAVTITVVAGPAFTEDNLETIDLIVPERPEEAYSLQVGDLVFFEAFEPCLEGEGTITDIYETEDPDIIEAVCLDHAYFE